MFQIIQAVNKNLIYAHKSVFQIVVGNGEFFNGNATSNHLHNERLCVCLDYLLKKRKEKGVCA